MRKVTTLMNPEANTAVSGKIVAFLREIGLPIRADAMGEDTVLPGIKVEHGGLLYDPAKLKYPGDLLHEAGHLAVKIPADRQACGADLGSDPAEEMMAISWSYARRCTSACRRKSCSSRRLSWRLTIIAPQLRLRLFSRLADAPMDWFDA